MIKLTNKDKEKMKQVAAQYGSKGGRKRWDNLRLRFVGNPEGLKKYISEHMKMMVEVREANKNK